MVYFEIGLDVDKKTIGKYPQMKTFAPDYDPRRPESMTNIRYDRFPDFVPDLRYEVEEKSKMTDVLGKVLTDSSGFLISEKLLGIFLKFNLCQHHIYDADVLHKGSWYRYFLLHILAEEDFSGIDFDNSVFFEEKFETRLRISDVKFHDEASYWKARSKFADEWHFIKAEKITLSSEFRKKEPDVFFFKYALTRVLFSERLVEEIKKQKITGFVFEREERVH